MFDWLGNKSDVTSTVLFCFYNPSTVYFYFLQVFFNLHAFLTMTDFYGVRVVKFEAGVWPAHLCCQKSLPWNLLCCKKCSCAVSLGKWTVTGIACSGRTEALQLPRCGWISSALSVLPIIQLHQQNCSVRSSTASKLWALWTTNCARLPLCA